MTTEIQNRLAELRRLDSQAEEINVLRGLTRGILVIALRQKRKQACLSLRDMASNLSCSAPMLHHIENGRRWSSEIVERYVRWFHV